jgi:hypothetical protein
MKVLTETRVNGAESKIIHAAINKSKLKKPEWVNETLLKSAQSAIVN